MMSFKLMRLLATPLLLVSAAVLSAQTPETAPPAEEPTPAPPVVQPAPKAQFFAGTVTDVDHDHVTVSRTLVGKAPESRTFLIKPETKVGKPLREKARVTVRYKSFPEGDVALEIRIHSQPRPPKAS
jgi:hypothetical protein